MPLTVHPIRYAVLLFLSGTCGRCPLPILFAGESPCRDLAPKIVTEKRTIEVTEYQTEIQERPISVQKFIPETKQVRDLHVDMVTQTERRVETCVEYVPVWREVEQEITVLVPTVETRTGTRKMPRRVQVEELCAQTVDRGQWENVCVNGDSVERVWKPCLVVEHVPVLTWRDELVDEPYEYSAVVHRPETRSMKVRVCDYVRQEKEREFEVTSCVPQGREMVRNVSTYRTVQVPGVERVKVCVPHKVKKEVCVEVCR